MKQDEVIKALDIICNTSSDINLEMNKKIITDYIYELKKIEKDLGVDLITYNELRKARSVYVYGYSGIYQCSLIKVTFNEIVVWNDICKSYYLLSDYGKSFALTKEELEK